MRAKVFKFGSCIEIFQYECKEDYHFFNVQFLFDSLKKFDSNHLKLNKDSWYQIEIFNDNGEVINFLSLKDVFEFKDMLKKINFLE